MIISEKRSKINFLSFLWHSTFLALASNFMDVDTIIPSMLIKIGGNSIHLGFLTAIMLGGASLFQLLFAPIISSSPIKKTHLIAGINIRIATLFFIGLMFYFSNNLSSNIIILLIFILITIFSLSGSYANVAYIDIIGKSILAEKRKKFFSIKEIITSTGIFVSAWAVKLLIKKYEYPFNYSLLFTIAAILLFIASLGFWHIKEIKSVKSEKRNFLNFFKLLPSETKKNKNLKNYLFIINTAGIGVGFSPFLILFAKESSPLTYNFIGNILLFKVTGMILASILFYKFSKHLNYKTILTFDIVLGASIPLLALILKDAPHIYQFIFVLSGIFISILKISNSGILLEISTNENRTIYAGIAGAGKIFSTLFPLISGVLIYYLSFTTVFIIVSIIIASSYFFIKNLTCKE